MEICIVGSSGHTGYVHEGIKKDSSLKISGIAAGTEGEDIHDLANRVEKVGQRPKIYDSYLEMFDQEKPDIVAAASQFNKQASITIEALKRNINVFVEKPVATTLEELEDVRKVYADSRGQLAAMFGIRYKPWFMAAWKMVQEGAIGKVRLMNAQKSYKLGTRADFYKKRESYGGTIPWVGSHAIDWLHWFSGEAFESVFANHSTRYNEDHGELEVTGLMHFNLSNSVMGSINIDYLRPATASTHDDDRIRIAGTKGIIEVRDQKVFLVNDKQKGVIEIDQEENGGIFYDFIKQVRGQGVCLISAEDSFYITEACLRARKSADENKVIYFSE